MRFEEWCERARAEVADCGEVFAAEACRRWDQKTKPPGSLGQLESVVAGLAGWQRTAEVRAERLGIFVFCGDHGVTAQGISAYPSEVTRQMVGNFLAGGAAINVLCRERGIATRVVDCGIRGGWIGGTIDARVGEGTADFSVGPAMSEEQLGAALGHGVGLAEAAAEEFDLVGIGEMGIGNTTAASALLAALGGFDPGVCVGRGAGLDEEGLRRKERVISGALSRLQGRHPLEVLRQVGGFEIAVMVGFVVGAAAKRLPVVVDGFIASSPVLVVERLVPGIAGRLTFSHLSTERGHGLMLGHLGVQPMLQLDLRLGEGTGAALAMGLMVTAVRLYREMATFESAAVSQRIQ